MNKTNEQKSSFDNLGISPSILKQLDKLNFKKPTPIQGQAIPIAIKGQDMMGIAQTGTGKTLAFGIPMIQGLFERKGAGLVLLPTRELALQVEESLKALGSSFGLRTAIIIGGTAIGPQIKALAKKPHIIIATPGRLIDHLNRRKGILSTLKILVLDEADRMLDMGFEPDIKKILAAVPPSKRQTMLFSATMPQKITQLAQKYMRSPLRVEVAPAGTTAKNIIQEVFIIPKNQKLSLLKQVLDEYQERVLVFSRTKHGAKKINKAVQNMGYGAGEIHSNRSLLQRTKALKDFKNGRSRVLVATDIASRGIDVKDIELVINYDLPDNPEDYVHRIGRTARAGKKGRAISFVVPEQKKDIFIIERLVRSRLPIKPLPDMKEVYIAPKADFGTRADNNFSSRPKRNFAKRNKRKQRFDQDESSNDNHVNTARRSKTKTKNTRRKPFRFRRKRSTD